MKDAAIILAAGKGVRMKSNLPKALCELSGRPIVEFLIDVAIGCGIKNIVVVGGHRIDLLRKRLADHKVDIVRQKRPLGSADAVKSAETSLRRFKGAVVVLYTDTPLIRPETIRQMLKVHSLSKAALTILTGLAADPKEYGRILRDREGRICDIVEHTDIGRVKETAGGNKRGHYEINIGAYCFDSGRLFEGLSKIKPNAIKKEYYLTDIVPYFYKIGYPINSCTTADETEALGINRREDLLAAEAILMKRRIDKLLERGVDIKDPSSTHIYEGVRIAAGTTIYPFSVIESNVIIGRGCKIGPFAHLRDGTVLKDGSEIGNFVEVVRSKIGEQTKAKHLTYIGDTVVGRKVNIGAGTVTANYDGLRKNKTVIDDKAFIGSSTTVVAPVRIGKGAVTGAGSVVVRGRDVPPKTVVVGVPARPLKVLKNPGGIKR